MSGPRKPQRRQHLRAELLVQLAMTLDRWGRSVVDQEPGLAPFGQWPPDDPLRELVERHELAPAEAQQECSRLAARLERLAERSGY
jgi:hypothetical protein